MLKISLLFMIQSLKFDIERVRILPLFTTFRESIYTNTLLGVEDCHHQKRGHPSKEGKEGNVHSFVHVNVFNVLISKALHDGFANTRGLRTGLNSLPF